MSVLFTEDFDIWYDSCGSFYELSCGWFCLSVGFLLGFALLKETVLGSGYLIGVCESGTFLLQEIQV